MCGGPARKSDGLDPVRIHAERGGRGEQGRFQPLLQSPHQVAVMGAAAAGVYLGDSDTQLLIASAMLAAVSSASVACTSIAASPGCAVRRWSSQARLKAPLAGSCAALFWRNRVIEQVGQQWPETVPVVAHWPS